MPTENEIKITEVESPIKELELKELIIKKNELHKKIIDTEKKLLDERSRINEIKEDIITTDKYRIHKLKEEEDKLINKIKILFGDSNESSDVQNIIENEKELKLKKSIATELYKEFKFWFLIFLFSLILIIGLSIWLIDFENFLFIKDIFTSIGPDLSIAIFILLLLGYSIIWWVFKLLPIYTNLKKAINEINKLVIIRKEIIDKIIDLYDQRIKLHIDFRLHEQSLTILNDFRKHLISGMYPKLQDVIKKLRNKKEEFVNNYNKKISELFPSSSTIKSFISSEEIEKIKLNDWDRIYKQSKSEIKEKFKTQNVYIDLTKSLFDTIESKVKEEFEESLKIEKLNEILIDPSLIISKFQIEELSVGDKKENIKLLIKDLIEFSKPFATPIKADGKTYHTERYILNKDIDESEIKSILVDVDLSYRNKFEAYQIDSKNNCIFLQLNSLVITEKTEIVEDKDSEEEEDINPK